MRQLATRAKEVVMVVHAGKGGGWRLKWRVWVVARNFINFFRGNMSYKINKSNNSIENFNKFLSFC